MNKQELIEKLEGLRNDANTFKDSEIKLCLLGYIGMFLSDIKKLDEPTKAEPSFKLDGMEFATLNYIYESMEHRYNVNVYSEHMITFKRIIEKLKLNMSGEPVVPAKEEIGNGVPFAIGDSVMYIGHAVKHEKVASPPEWENGATLDSPLLMEQTGTAKVVDESKLTIEEVRVLRKMIKEVVDNSNH